VARCAARRPLVPDEGRCVLGGSHRCVDRLQARERGRPGEDAAGSRRVPPVLRRLATPSLGQAATPALVTRRPPWQNQRIPDCVQPCSHERPSTCVDFSKPGSIAAERPRARVGAAYSALVGWGATRPLPSRLRGLAYRAFARAVGANLDEVELALGGYPSLGDFFARRWRRGAREVDAAPGAIISPCDGVLAARGTAVAGALVQAKGRTYQ